MKNKSKKLRTKIRRGIIAKINNLTSIISDKIIQFVISKNILYCSVSTCAVISVDKIRKNATFINKVVIYGERGSGEDADVESS